MKIVGGKNLPSARSKSKSREGHYKEADLAREFGGTFVPDSHGCQAGVFASLEFVPELAEDEEYLDRSSFIPIEEFSTDEGCGHEGDYDELLPFDSLVEAVEQNFNVVSPIAENPGYIGIAYHMAKEEFSEAKLFNEKDAESGMRQLFLSLPAITSAAVQKFGAEAVISALESEPAQDNVDSLFSLVRAARIELNEQKNGRFNRGVACGILQAIGFTVAEIDKIKATGKIRPASLAA